MAVSKISGDALADLLSRWPAWDGPLYRLFADRIAMLADTGELPAGLRLPPERELASALSVSRNTAAAAYQLLRDEGLAETRQGAGTRIAPHVTTAAAVHRANGLFAGLLQASSVEVDLTLAAVECAPQVTAALCDPDTVLSEAERRAVIGTTGYFPLGLPELRTALAELLTARHGLPATSGQILVTTGGQQAIDLLMRSFVIPGQAVVVEDPTFPGAIDALHRAGARPIGLPASHGLDPDRLARAVTTHRPALVYLIPAHHNPTGLVMPAASRLRIAELAAAHPGTLFVDDMTLAEHSLRTGPNRSLPPPLAAAEPGLPNLVTIGSLSKLYWGGLRIGWIRAVRPMISRLAAAKAAADLGSNVLGQAVTAAVIASKHADIVRWRTGRLRARRDVMHAALRQQVPDWSWELPEGGLTLWVQLPGGADGGAFAQAALRRGVSVVPGRLLSTADANRDWIRIAYTRSPAELRAAVPPLAQAWHGIRDRWPAGRRSA
ncbi:MAG TPA: PLP-dependent aminotransferase family protein [Streptosporangiaceae bacterium]|nr:PLP-dependent aminotransferase family protein [Streptosporangiaceae bacterium]